MHEFKKSFFLTILLILFNTLLAQKPKLMLPIGHTNAGINNEMFFLAPLVYSASFSPDGKKIVTASKDGTAKVWDVKSGTLLTNFKGHTTEVNGASFSPDGKKIVTISRNNTVKIWDAKSGICLVSLKEDTYEENNWVFDLNIATFSPDGKKIVTRFKDFTVKIWDTQSGAFLTKLDEQAGNISKVSFSPDGKKIVTASYGDTAKIWDAQSGALLADLKGHIDWVNSALFSPDGKTIVTASYDSTAKIWDVQSGAILADLKGHIGKVNSASFSPDGKIIVTTSEEDSTAKIWNAQSWKSIADLKEYKGKINSASFSPDGKKIVTTSDSIVRIWDVKSRIVLAELKGNTVDLKNTSFSPDGKKLVTTSLVDDTPKIWDAQSGAILADLKGYVSEVYNVSFSPDGKKILTIVGDSTVKLWDVQSGAILANLKGQTGGITSASFSPDGKKVLTTGLETSAINIWDAESGTFLTELKGQTSDVIIASFFSDGKKIVTTSWDDNFKIWDAASGDYLTDLKGQKSWGYGDSMSPFGSSIVTISDDSTTKIFEMPSWSLLAVLKIDKDQFKSATFSPASPNDPLGKKKIVTMLGDNTIKLWNTQSGAFLTDLKGNTDNVSSVYFSPDGKKIITTSDNFTTELWDAETGAFLTNLKGNKEEVYLSSSTDWKKVLTVNYESNSAKILDAQTGAFLVDLKGFKGEVRTASFSPDGKKIVTTFDFSAKIWDAQTGACLDSLTVDNAWVSYAYFSSNGKKIIILLQGNNVGDELRGITHGDDNIIIWDAENGAFLKDLKVLDIAVNNSSFSPDGKKIVTASSDGNTKIWDAQSWKLLADLIGHTGEVRSVSFSPDGKKIVTASYDNTCKIWNSENGKLLYSFFAVNSSDYLLVDQYNHYDGTDAARKLLYFTCEDEVINLDQVKDLLWVPGIAGRINDGEEINAKTLSDLKICGLTPEVEDLSSNADEYYFKINPRRGGLGETVLLVNGIEARRFKPEDLKKNGGVYDLLIKKAELKSFFIAGKANPVIVKAYTSDNSISSRGIIIEEDLTKAAKTPPNLYAVMVGVSDYKGDELDLKYAAKDATDISNAVSASAKKLLNTDNKEHVFMYNLTTTKERYQLPEKNSIKKLLEEIGKKATANDILLIFFAGHGIMTGEGDKKQFYFLTADASSLSAGTVVKDVGISTTELTEWMKPQNIKAQKRILIFDACNSGQAISDFVKMGNGDQNYIAARSDDKAQQIKAIDKLNEKSGLFILSASASNQSAYEMGRYSQGLLTYSLLKAIKQQPDILEGGKYLNVSRWFNAAERTVSEISKESGARQEPQIVTNTNFNIGLVDEDVMAKIILPQEKPLFAASNFQNSDDAIADDNLELSKLINLQLSDMAARGTDSKIVYVTATNSADAWSLSGRYEVSGNTILVRVNAKQNKEIKHRFEVSGTKDKLKELAASITEKAAMVTN